MSTAEEYEKSLRDMIRLIACLVNDVVPDRSWCETLNLEGLYHASRKHMLEAITCEALEKAGVHQKTFYLAREKAVQRNLLLDHERKRIAEEFEKKGIWYVFLKGIVLQKYYPKYGLRQMLDNDVLIDPSRTDDIRGIMENLGFETIEFGNQAHDVYHKKSTAVAFEMHVSLFAEYISKQFHEYYENTTDRLIWDKEHTFEAKFTKEDFYLYLIAHEYKHFTERGTGIRSILDVYLYLKKENLDWQYVQAEAEKMGIADFEKKNRNLALHLFGMGEELTSEDLELFDSFAQSGALGSVSARVKSRSAQIGGGKLRYVIRRFSFPISKKNVKYVAFASHYPVFYKYKILLPLLPFYRIWRSVKTGGFQEEFEAMKDIKNHDENK